MSTPTFMSRIFALVSVVRRRSLPTQAKRRLEWMEAIPGLKNETWGTRRTSLSSRPLRLRSGQARVEGSAFSVLSFASALLLTVFILLAAASAHAQTTYTVTNTNSSGTGSLAAAVASVDADTGTSGDTIDFASGVTGTITPGSTLALSHNVTITGPGANLLTVSGGGTVTVFIINSGVTASLSGLTIANGNSGNGVGGGIYNYGTLTVSNSTIFDNTASGGDGGGIFNGGTLTVSNSTFSGNTASDGNGYGGGIFNGGTLTVSNSTFSGNTANGQGGGLGDGGGIFNQGTLTVSNSTFSGNTASYGGGITNSGGAVTTLTNSIVAGNTDTSSGQAGNDCYGCTQSANNLISTPSNIINPMLGTLAYNGGPTETMMPLTGSPALNAGSGSTLSTDQRGDPRPTGNGVVSDLGAVQVENLTVTTTADTTNSGTSCDGTATCSLRDAIGLANSYGSGDISFASSITSTPSTITLTSALPFIAASITITGPGANLLTVSGNNKYQVFVVNSGVTASLSGLTIANGTPPLGSYGGGIFNDGGTLTVSNSAFSGNTGDGGGIFNNCGTLTVSNSTFSGNSAGGGSGGGIFNQGTLTVGNSTFSGNSANYGYGGGIDNDGTLTVSNSTFSGNSAGGGGGIYGYSGSATITNSIVAGNSGGDCTNCGTQSASNLISTSAAPITAAQLMLGPLAYNGANQTLQTLLPLPGSPAIEAGNPALLPSSMTTDERGLPRTTTISGASKLDLGAVETNYTAVQFVQQPTNTLVNATINATMTPPAVTLSVMESGAAALNIPVPLTLTGNGTLAGTTTETTLIAKPGTAAVATYGNLSVNAAGTGDTLGVTLPITPAGAATPLTLTATSNSFDITLQTTTITWTTTPPTNVTYGAAPITLAATDNSGATVLYQVISGPATISGNTLSFTGAGAVVVEAYTNASGNYGSGSLTANINVNKAALTVTASNATRVYGAANPTFTGTVTGAVNGDTFTETFSTTATASSAVGSYPITPTVTGTHLSDYTVTTTNGALTVTKAALKVTANNFSRAYGAANPTFTGTVTGMVNGDTFTESFSTTATTTSAVGTYPITPTAAGTHLSDYTVTTTNGTLTVSAAISTTTLTASASAIIAGQPVTFTATVQSGTTLVPSGTVNFYNGTTLLGPGAVTNGVATFTTSTLAAGGNPAFTASYVGTVDYAASTSATVMVTVATPIPPSFTMAATPNTLTIPTGGIDASTLTITPTGGYTGKLTLSCSGLPANAYCYFPGNAGAQTTTVTLNGSNTAQSIALNIETGAMTAPSMARMQAMPSPFGPDYSPVNPSSPLSPILPALAFWWPGSMAGLAAFGRKRGLSKTQQRMLQLCLLVLMTGALAAGISGCAGLTSSAAAVRVTPAGTSTVTVTAAPASGTPQTTTITLTIT